MLKTHWNPPIIAPAICGQPSSQEVQHLCARSFGTASRSLRLNWAGRYHGNLWQSMEIYMEIYGNLWKPMEIYGNLWKPMEIYIEIYGKWNMILNFAANGVIRIVCSSFPWLMHPLYQKNTRVTMVNVDASTSHWDHTHWVFKMNGWDGMFITHGFSRFFRVRISSNIHPVSSHIQKLISKNMLMTYSIK